MSQSDPFVKKILKECQSGNISSLITLQRSNPNFHWSHLKYPKTGDTVLHALARLGNAPIVQHLLEYTPSGVNCKNNDSKTPLHEAAQFAQPHIVKLLLDNGAFVNALKRADWTPLMLACTKDSPLTVKLLLDKGAVVNVRNKDGWSALHVTARTGNTANFNILLENGADFKALTRNGRSPLHIAALHANFDVVKLLLGLGLDPGQRDSCGNTALHEAVLGRSLPICRLLIGRGADPAVRNGADLGLLHLASSQGHCDVIEYIVIELFGDINETNEIGLSPLHCAARNNRYEAYDLLIRLGACFTLCDLYGRMAKDYFKKT